MMKMMMMWMVKLRNKPRSYTECCNSIAAGITWLLNNNNICYRLIQCPKKYWRGKILVAVQYAVHFRPYCVRRVFAPIRAYPSRFLPTLLIHRFIWSPQCLPNKIIYYSAFLPKHHATFSNYVCGMWDVGIAEKRETKIMQMRSWKHLIWVQPDIISGLWLHARAACTHISIKY